MMKHGRAKILVGEYQGNIGYITWYDGIFVRITPINGEPLTSIQLKCEEVRVL